MSSKQNKTAIIPKTDYDGSTPQRVKLDEKQILTNPTKQAIFNSLMSGLNLKEAAKEVNKNYKYVRNMVAKNGINSLVLQKRAEIGQKCGITASYLQREYLDLAKSCIKKGKEGVARACYADLMKSIGGFQADAPSDKAIELKQMDAGVRLEIAQVLNRHIDEQYLSIKPVDNTVVSCSSGCSDSEDSALLEQEQG